MMSETFDGTYQHWKDGQIENPTWLFIVEVSGFEYPPVAGSNVEAAIKFLGFILCDILGFSQTEKMFTEKIDENWKIKLQKIENDNLVTFVYTYHNKEWCYKKTVLDEAFKDGG